jgi:hypothetical protein
LPYAGSADPGMRPLSTCVAKPPSIGSPAFDLACQDTPARVLGERDPRTAPSSRRARNTWLVSSALRLQPCIINGKTLIILFLNLSARRLMVPLCHGSANLPDRQYPAGREPAIALRAGESCGSPGSWLRTCRAPRGLWIGRNCVMTAGPSLAPSAVDYFRRQYFRRHCCRR